MSKKKRVSGPARKREDLDEPADPNTSLPGWPGYRTRDGRSGYDPIDTRTEAAHVAGTIFQKLITEPIRNPVYLTLLGILGLALIVPLVITLVDLMNGHLFPWSAWLFALISAIAGLAILFNFVRSLIRRIRR